MSAPVSEVPPTAGEDHPSVLLPEPIPLRQNLLRNRAIAGLLRSRWYPRIFQVPVAAVFGFVAYELLVGPDRAQENSGTALMWVLWWPVLPALFVILGRFWCAVCPFGAISDLVQKLVGAHRPVPRFLKTYGIWIIDAQFLAITWSDRIWGIVESPWGSGVLLLLLTTGVIASGAFLQRRAFCRYLCFLGGLCGNYGRTGMVELRADQTVCATCTSRAACYHGTATVPGCPLFSFVRTMDSTANCSLCANCIKACPNDAIQIRVRKPVSELWFIRTPRVEESFLALAIMGIVLIQNITMLGVWSHALDWIAVNTGITDPAVVFTFAFTIAVAAPVALLGAVSRVAAAGNAAGTWTNFARFGYALIPLDIAAHLGHNLFHLLAEGGTVISTVLATFGVHHAAGSAALAGPGVIRLLQYLLLAAGAAGSGYTALRIARHHHGQRLDRVATLMPYLALISFLVVVNAALFALPMTHRM